MLENNFQKVSILARTFMSRASLKKLLRDFPNEEIEIFIRFFFIRIDQSGAAPPTHSKKRKNFQFKINQSESDQKNFTIIPFHSGNISYKRVDKFFSVKYFTFLGPTNDFHGPKRLYAIFLIKFG
jgi:hypothetical protein